MPGTLTTLAPRTSPSLAGLPCVSHRLAGLFDEPAAPVAAVTTTDEPGGRSLAEDFGEPDEEPTVYLRISPTGAATLIDRLAAAALLAGLVRSSARLAGNLDFGFTWGRACGSVRLWHVVRPVRVIGLPASQPLHLTIEISWGPGLGPDDGSRSVRYRGLFPNSQTAYLVACCLGSGPEGRHARSVTLIAEDGAPYPIAEIAQVCGLIDKTLLEVVRATATPVETAPIPPPP